MTERLRFRLLGGLGLEGPGSGAAESVLSQPKMVALLARLAAGGEPFVQRDLLVDLLWPEASGRRARNALNQLVHRLRQDLGEEILVSRGRELLGLGPSITSDVREFERAAAEGHREEAVALYRGEFLPGFHLSGNGGFERWMEQRRMELAARAWHASLDLANRASREGEGPTVAGWLRRALAIRPHDETTMRRLLVVLEAIGERAEALRAYERFRSELEAELGVEPSPETRELGTALWTSGTGAPGPPLAVREGRRPPVVAVLPLENLTAEPDEEFFADGMTDALITELARRSALRVISRHSVMAFKGSRRGASEIGRALGADALVEGSVTRSTGRVRITAQLLQVEPETHLWADRFDRPLEDVLDVHAEVAGAIAREVLVALGHGEREPTGSAVEDPVTGTIGWPALPQLRSEGRHPVDPVAYEAYLKGRYFSAMLPQIPRAIECFKTALARDERFAPAWAGLAMCYANLALFVYLPPADAFPKLEAAARRALALDGSAGEGHTAEALSRMLAYRDWKGAEEAFHRAIELSPGSADSRGYRAAFLASMGRREEGLAEARRAVELDPLGPGTRYMLAWCHYKSHEYDRSIQSLEDALELYPHFALAHPLRAANFSLLGRHQEAVAAARTGVEALDGDQEALMYAVAALSRAGEAGEARELLERLKGLEKVGYLDPFAVAVGYAALGETETAAQWVRRTYDRRSPSAFCLLTEPLLDPARDEPAFREVIRRLGFPGH